MNNPPKPPKRIRVVYDKEGEFESDRAIDDLNERFPNYAPFTEHFYTLEEKEKPMEPKKEMTDTDAWIAMANGECVKTSNEVVRLLDAKILQFWTPTYWTNTSFLPEGPYSIVPDPSKPEVKVDKYEKELGELLETIINGKASLEKTLIKMTEFNNKHYQRKEPRS
jgi:hypothetical protein